MLNFHSFPLCGRGSKCRRTVGHVEGFAGVAQLVEHLICNQRVGGSNPFASSRVEELRVLGSNRQAEGSVAAQQVFPKHSISTFRRAVIVVQYSMIIAVSARTLVSLCCESKA